MMTLPNNDSGCGWLNIIPTRTPMPRLNTNVSCDWLIIGAGYTGLSAARELAKLKPNDRIVIIDAQRAGEGASARNSGYLVDSTLNDGHMSDQGLNLYKQKYELNLKALQRVKQFVTDYQVDCDWSDSGKFHATAIEKNQTKLQQFHQVLSECGINSKIIQQRELTEKLGTPFYRMAVHTEGGVMLQPAKLVRAMIDTLPATVELYENSPVLNVQQRANGSEINTAYGQINCKNLLLCSNGFLPSLGFQKDRAFPLTLTASLTRPLSATEYEQLGAPKPWGLLSAQAMGATVRLTDDKRIMIRNTAEAFHKINMSKAEIESRIDIHRQGLYARFPSLPQNIIEHSWSGVTCISQNSANIFQQQSNNCWVAGCYNGGGIGLATHFGEQLAHYATGEHSDDIEQILQRPTPNRLPPNPALRWGVKIRLAKDRFFAQQER